MAASRNATHGDAGDAIFGRERELGRLGDLVDRLPERGAALLVRGEAGIGKSTLLAAATRRAEKAGIRVLRATGVQSEARLPFAGLHQLVLPLLDQADRLPVPQRTALLTAFGMTEASEAPDRFLIALAVLELLSEAAERAPLLVAVDDAQWIDRSSAGVLAFVARRVEHEPIGVLAASRDGVDSFFEEAGLPELRLAGLDDAASGALLDAHGRRLEPAVRDRLREQTGGNPLALVELPLPLGSDELDGRSPLPTPLPLTSRLERAFAVRIAGLPTATRTLLLLAAADDGCVLREIFAAASVFDGMSPTAETFEPTVGAGLVRIDGGRLEFRHPLVRSAIYQMAGAVERRAVQAAWAEVLTDQPDRRVWHRAAALLGPDEAVAAELEAAATRALRRGAISVAIMTLERAIQVGSDPLARGQRLLDAAELAFEMGRSELVLRLVDEAEPLGLGAVDRQRITLVRELFDYGVPGDAVGVEQVIESAEQTRRHRGRDPAMTLLRRAAVKSWWVGRDEEPREHLAAAARRMSPPDDPQRLMILAMVEPSADATDVLERLSLQLSDGTFSPNVARMLGIAGYAAGHFELAADALSVAIAGMRQQGRPALLAHAVVTRAMAALQLGRRDLAASDTEEGYRLSAETGQTLFAENARAAQALLAGLRGEEEAAEILAARAEHAMLPLRVKAVLSDVQLARGITALGAGRYDDAYENLIRMVDPNDPAEHYRRGFWAVGDIAEAAVHSGHRDEARAVLARAEAAAGPMPSPRMRVSLDYARPLLAEDDEAEGLFEAGLNSDLAGWPFARARLQLALGSWLRRQRRVVESRAPLRVAREAFDALGLDPFSGRARNELRASGVESRPRGRGATDGLTPQELQIARMAASGLSNRQIGDQLYLSHRTVGAHLYRAFPKLGITARGQLQDVLDSNPP